jgi:hypothetical protein
MDQREYTLVSQENTELVEEQRTEQAVEQQSRQTESKTHQFYIRIAKYMILALTLGACGKFFYWVWHARILRAKAEDRSQKLKAALEWFYNRPDVKPLKDLKGPLPGTVKQRPNTMHYGRRFLLRLINNLVPILLWNFKVTKNIRILGVFGPLVWVFLLVHFSFQNGQENSFPPNWPKSYFPLKILLNILKIAKSAGIDN